MSSDDLVLALHRKAIVVDAHADTLLDVMGADIFKKGHTTLRPLGERSGRGHIDLPRLQEGGVDLQIFAVWPSPEFVPNRELARALQILDVFYQEYEKNSRLLHLVLTASDIDAIEHEGRIGVLLSIEGGEVLQSRLNVLRMLFRLGVRALTLTWNARNQLGDGANEVRTHSGLTEFGIQVIAEMNRLGMLIDVSHLNEAGFFDAMAATRQPVIASHSNCRALCDHRRNLTDAQLEAIASNGGVVGITYVPDFLSKDPATLDHVLNHIDYAARKVGVDHVGLGSDFDGVETLPQGLDDVSKLPNLTRGLVARGYSEDEVLKILGGNFLRVLRQVLR